MPHFTFFRPALSSSPDQQPEIKKANRRLSSSRRTKPSLSDRSPSSSGSSLVSQDGSVKMVENPLKRLSKNILQPKNASSSSSPHAPAAVELDVESPPLVLYGSANSSGGALASGVLKITVNEDTWSISTFKMQLNMEIKRKKPFHSGCADCIYETDQLEEWNFLTAPVTTLQRGVHLFPFSYLFPGSLHASMHSPLNSIEYWLRMTIVPQSGEPLKLSHMFDLKRAVLTNDQPRHSIRIFPPTNLTANCQLPPVIYPIGETRMSMRLDGVVKRNVDTKTQTMWRLTKLSWTLEETGKHISPACAKHAAKVPAGGDISKAHEHTASIGSGVLLQGWKTNYTSPDGTVEVEFPFSVRGGAKASCNTKDEQGTEVSHMLIVEMIVCEEYAPIKKPHQTTPTGGARVLRMHFNVNLTERAGLGVSWEEEAPPLYGDVPASPPSYGIGHASEYAGPIPSYEDLLPLDDSPVATPPFSPTVGEGAVRHRLSITDLELDTHIPSTARDEAESTTHEQEEDIYAA